MSAHTTLHRLADRAALALAGAAVLYTLLVWVLDLRLVWAIVGGLVQEGHIAADQAGQLRRTMVFLATLPLPFFGVAVFALVRQPRAASARLLALLLAGVSFLFTSLLRGVAAGLAQGASGEPVATATLSLPAHDIPVLVLASLAPGFWLHLALRFPAPPPRLERQPWLAYLLAYGLVLPGMVTFLQDPRVSTAPAVGPAAVAGLLVMIGQVIAGGLVLIVRGGQSRDALARRQVSILLRTVGTGLVLSLALAASLGLVTAHVASPPPALMVLLAALFLGALMLVPLGFAYAMMRYRLLQVEARLRRGLAYLMSSAGLLVLALSLLLAATVAVSRVLGLAGTDRVIVGLVLALAYRPLHTRLQQRLGRRLFRATWQLRELLEGFLAASGTLPDRPALWDRFDGQLRAAAGVQRSLYVLRDTAHGTLQQPDDQPPPPALGQELVAALGREGGPVDVAELAERPDGPLGADQVAWLEARGIDVLLPLAPRGEPRGLMALGFGDGYREIRAQELELIAHIGARTVLEDDNLRLREETLERRRLQEQLAMAQAVQRRFLPAELPATVGLDLAAVCRPCLEVAGDTYDVLALPGDRTLLSIADVSGKGAGAAMIMANVQASVRALAGAGQEPAAIAAHLNDLLVRSTAPQQFATLFLAVYEPATGALRYVNAGHEPPLLWRAGGPLETLAAGGTVVGALADLPYTAGQIELAAGDVLLACTDGVTEATAPDGAMFGEDRLHAALTAVRSREPGELLAEIEAVVERFRAGREPDDDVTLLAARAHGAAR